jgi:hypothetical protein
MNSDLRGRERSGRVRERVTCCLSLGTRTSSHGDGWQRCQWSFSMHSANPNRWVCRWGWGARRTSCLKPSAPTSLYSTGIRGPPTIKGRAPPIRAQSRGRDRAVGLGHGEINPTFSPLISTLLFTLCFILYSFHHGSVHRACFIVTAQLPIESDSHHILFCFETNPVTFGPLLIQKS